MVSSLRIVICSLVLLAGTASAHAEAVKITHGVASVDIMGGNFFVFKLQGIDFAADGTVYRDEAGAGVNFTWPSVAQTNYLVDTSSKWSIYQAFALDTPPLQDYWAGNFQFIGGVAPLSCISKESNYDCIAQTPFDFKGSLTHWDEGRLLLKRDLVGSGRATLAIDENLIPLALGYVFDDAAPVPEPETLLLFATGLGAIGRRAWKGRTGYL